MLLFDDWAIGEQLCHIIRLMKKWQGWLQSHEIKEHAFLRVYQQWDSLVFCVWVVVRSISLFMLHCLCWLWLSNIGFIYPHISRVHFIWKELDSWRCIQSKYAWFIPSGKYPNRSGKSLSWHTLCLFAHCLHDSVSIHLYFMHGYWPCPFFWC